ncbi:uncharacterized protein VNE69_08156 [Vairimorpha necatrix]|uniref:Uncharacterized protein n=1 Tax=Vairimorpha necatrix TaxID=6039 RepID=A0AAX4JF48_9MICR
MLFYFILISCSEFKNDKKEVLDFTREKTEAKANSSIINRPVSIRHKLLINEKVETREYSTISSDSRFHPYEKDLLKKSPSNCEIENPNVSSVQSLETTNINILRCGDQYIQDQKLANCIFLLNNLRSVINKWDKEDLKLVCPIDKLKFKDKENSQLYMNLKRKLYMWINNPSIINKLLVDLSQLILKSKIDDKRKVAFFFQLEICYETMTYVYKLLPFKENRKLLSSGLLVIYKRMAPRFHILFYKMNLLEVFLDFIKMFRECCDVEDPTCLQIEDLVKFLDQRLYITYSGLGSFIETINSISKILENSLKIII